MIKLIQSMHNLIAALIAKSKSATPFDEALSFNEAGRYKEALALMEQSAEGGNGRDMAILGTMFLLGDGVAENGKEAERWLKWSIEAGYGRAASVLGMAYATGKAGIKQNIPLACEVLSKAAAEGDQTARQMLEAINKRRLPPRFETRPLGSTQQTSSPSAEPASALPLTGS